MTPGLVDVGAVMRGLKDFQRATVEHTFERLFLAEDSTHRFLVADEVGLGKTMVARGVVAKAIDHLQREGVEKIDVIYICSNAEIARQNVARLAVTRDESIPLARRLTLLPSQIRELAQRRLNLIALTPATSFDHGSAMGVRQERVLLFGLLREAWQLHGTGPANVLQGTVRDSAGFRADLRAFDPDSVDPDLATQFILDLSDEDRRRTASGEPGIRARFDAVCDAYKGRRALFRLPWELRVERSRVIAELRSVLAATCVEALEPDLVILDEFQRFKHLISDDESDAARLARKLFEWQSDDANERARVLMLSATPYRMYTVAGDGRDDDHHTDFLATVRFLAGEERANALRDLLRDYKAELYAPDPAGSSRLEGLQEEIESQLFGVMARTERLGASGDRNGMLVEYSHTPTPTANDVRGYLAIQNIARELEQSDMIEYWKSAPYLLNFMEGYELRRQFTRALDRPAQHQRLARLLSDGRTQLLDRTAIERFVDADLGAARLRQLSAETIAPGAWRLLWIAPAMPYYKLGGAFADERLQQVTKRLVFSAWRAVPRAAASLLSYQAEREVTLRQDSEALNTPAARRLRGNRLRFTRTEGRLTGMPILAWLYPSPSLARLTDPLDLARLDPDATLAQVLEWARQRVEQALTGLPEGPRDGPEDQHWYWAAPILLDRRAQLFAWWDRHGLAAAWTGSAGSDDEEGGLFADHVRAARDVDSSSLGRRPEDLSRVLALLGVAGAGPCALRAVCRPTGLAWEETAARDAAARVAWALRTVFNSTEATMLVSIEHEEARWRGVLRYSADGGLQAVLDEYAHMLLEGEGLQNHPPDEAAEGIAEAMVEAMNLRAAPTVIASYAIHRNRLDVEQYRLRTAFAARFGDDESGPIDDGGRPTRPGQLRAAFNSPFWPFVLVSTSVGQEGLDFHPYCHAVVHWNLPHNPIDLEQREGRVHRYKNHAVRRNVAADHRAGALQGGGDPWAHAFRLATADRDPTQGDLVPFWIYPKADGAHIERHVLALPLSRDLDRLESLRSALAVYRLAFGQARQDDLVAYLVSRLGQEGAEQLAARLRIDLRPRLQDWVAVV